MHYNGCQKVRTGIYLRNLDMHAAPISTELKRLVKRTDRERAKVSQRGTSDYRHL